MFQDKRRFNQFVQIHNYVNCDRRQFPDKSQKKSDQYRITPHYKKITVQPELRIVWVLREVDDMSYEEIAKTLNLTESTVRGRLARARSLVMRNMKEWA